MSKQLFLVAVAVFAAFFSRANSCSCFRQHEQPSFCSSQNAMEFRVIEKTVVIWTDGKFVERRPEPQHYVHNGQVFLITEEQSYEPLYNRYKISDLIIYKGKSTLEKVNMTYVYSPQSGASCGRRLKVGATYAVIKGFMWDDYFHVGLCMHLVNLDRLGTLERAMARHNLKVSYKEGCKSCRVVTCRSGDRKCLSDQSAGICKTSALRTKNSYDYRFQTACVPDITGACDWIGVGKLLPIAPRARVPRRHSRHLPKAHIRN